MDHFTRRAFLRVGAVASAGAAAWTAGILQRSPASSQGGLVDPADLFGRFDGYGALVPDPAGMLDLPPGFRYAVLGRSGDPMDGGLVPAAPDGMEVFDAGGGDLALVMNHELPESFEGLGIHRPGDRAKSSGGCTTMIVGPDDAVKARFVTQSDTLRNCAGGTTPWGTWMTCEEFSVEPGADPADPIGYGYVYDVDPFTGVNGPRIPSMGRFQREAVVVDPQTGVIYMTEDRDDGCLYRWIPDAPLQRPHEGSGGRVEGMAVRPPRGRGDRLRVTWVDLTDVVGTPQSLRAVAAQRGCQRFRGNEGIAMFGGSVYFDEGQGGAAARGAIWRYRPAEEAIELYYEAGPDSLLVQPDNLREHPRSGDIIHCEDRDAPTADQPNQLVLQDAQGSVMTFARSPLQPDGRLNEFAGCCWSPDGRRLFVNLQQSGLTLVISGPFRGALAAERARLTAGAAPTGGVRRANPDQLAQARRDRGMGPLEVEAALRLGLAPA